MTLTNASLYAGNLDESVTETTLFQIFNQVGPVSTVHICRDYVTRRSLGYAYVNFQSPSDAERALNTLNYTMINYKPVRLMWTQRDPTLRRTGVGNIFIKNLADGIDDKSLHDTFSAFGNILSCKVVRDRTGNSKHFGFVHYQTGEAAQLAISRVDGMLVNDKIVSVTEYIPKEERSIKQMTNKENFTNCYVNNIHSDVTEQEFVKMAEDIGKVTSSVLFKGPLDNGNKFGFCNFANHNDAVNYVKKYNGFELKEKKLFVNRAMTKSERMQEINKKYEQEKQERINKIKGLNLYVKNIEESVTDEELEKMFSKFGTIQSCRISKEKIFKEKISKEKISKEQVPMKSRGFGFVCFTTNEEAVKAIAGMNGKILGSKPLYVAYAMSKQQRLESLQQAILTRRMRYPPPGTYNPQMMNPAMFYGVPNMQGQQNYIYPNVMGRPRWANNPNRRAPKRNYPSKDQSKEYGSHANRFQYTSQVRNQPTNTPNVQSQQSVPTQAGGTRLDAQALANAPPEQQRQMIGNIIYEKVVEKYPSSNIPEFAGRVTGILLEIPVSELLHLIENPELLSQKIQEAKNVIN